MVERISQKHFSQFGVKDSVMLTVSTTHTRKIWQMDQVKYPNFRLFRDNNYFRFGVYFEYKGRNTLSSACSKVH